MLRRFAVLIVTVVAAGALGIALRHYVRQPYVLTNLGTLGGARSEAYALNAAGDVVGRADTIHGECHAFFWSNGKIRDLGTLGGKASDAYGINNRGQIVGMSVDADEHHRAFLWQGGKMRD